MVRPSRRSDECSKNYLLARGSRDGKTKTKNRRSKVDLGCHGFSSPLRGAKNLRKDFRRKKKKKEQREWDEKEIKNGEISVNNINALRFTTRNFRNYMLLRGVSSFSMREIIKIKSRERAGISSFCSVIRNGSRNRNASKGLARPDVGRYDDGRGSVALNSRGYFPLEWSSCESEGERGNKIRWKSRER